MERRVRLINDKPHRDGSVIYWMSRDQRVNDNWALLFAQHLAHKRSSPLAVVFCLQPSFLTATYRHYAFMLDGLAEVEQTLRSYNIPFFLLSGDPGEVLPPLLASCHAGALVTDFSPLTIKQKWQQAVTERITAAFYEVDTHNIIPCWIVSTKQEYAAYTIRPKIHRLLPQYLGDIPKLLPHNQLWPETVTSVDWQVAYRSLTGANSADKIEWLTPGEQAARDNLGNFICHRLENYDKQRNNPVLNATSRLSPYLHFGQLSAQRIAKEVLASCPLSPSVEAFLEEMIVRRELSDNYCFYNPDYASLSGAPPWAKQTLDEHRRDPRLAIYSQEELERTLTHDDLWNAAQYQLMTEGIIHGYLRMYWAKKILEWTPEPEIAWRIAVCLNDKYALDGRDPNGYTGIAWSIGGVHDRPWFERSIFGKIRYMSYNGCKSKFDIKAYITKYKPTTISSLF